MQEVDVASSSVEKIRYHEEEQTLEMIFLNGNKYRFLNVPQIEFDTLIQAPSIGSYFNRNIRTHYPFERIG